MTIATHKAAPTFHLPWPDVVQVAESRRTGHDHRYMQTLCQPPICYGFLYL